MFILVHDSTNKQIIINLFEIQRVMAGNNFTDIIMKNGETIRVNEKIGYFYDNLHYHKLLMA